MVHRDYLNESLRPSERHEGIIPYPPCRLSERLIETIRIAHSDYLFAQPNFQLSIFNFQFSTCLKNLLSLKTRTASARPTASTSHRLSTTTTSSVLRNSLTSSSARLKDVVFEGTHDNAMNVEGESTTNGSNNTNSGSGNGQNNGSSTGSETGGNSGNSGSGDNTGGNSGEAPEGDNMD